MKLMRTSRTLSITLPPEMLSRAEKLAKSENRTMSELVREALRYYEQQRWWEETNAYGRARAHALGIREQDVERLIGEARTDKRPKRSRK
jgi:predicted transcriptional regulator